MASKSAAATPYWKQAVAILAAGWVVIWISRMMLTPIYPVLSDYFGGVTNTQLGAISSFYFLGYVVMQIPSGILVDRVGMRRVIVPGFLVFMGGIAVMALASSLEMLYVGSAVSGVGSGTFYGIAYTITNTLVPREQKSLATAIVNSGTAVGSGMGLVSASCLVSTGILPWQALAAATAVFAGVMALVFARTLPGKQERDASAAGSASARSGVAQLFSARMIAAYVLYFSTIYIYYLISTWLPNFLEAERGFESSFTGIVSSLVFFAGIPGALIFSRLADKMPARKIPIICALELAASVALFVMVTSPSQPVIVASIVLYGFLGKLTVEPILISWLGQYAPAGSVATMFGVFNTCGMAASVVSPSVTGMIADALGSSVTGYYLAIAIILAGTAAFLLINRACSAK